MHPEQDFNTRRENLKVTATITNLSSLVRCEDRNASKRMVLFSSNNTPSAKMSLAGISCTLQKKV